MGREKEIMKDKNIQVSKSDSGRVDGPFVDDVKRTVKEAFIYGAEWQRKQPQWISVEDRLPNPGEIVLLYDSKSIRHYIGRLREKKGYKKGMWRVSNIVVDDDDITHWTPIPPFNETLK